jgi:hypothetical protein
MSNKSFESWVPRSAVEATMGVEHGEGSRSREALISGGPGKPFRYADLPIDVFGWDGEFVGLAFDGEIFTYGDLTEQTQLFVREFAERNDLYAKAVFAADHTFAGFHIVPEQVLV